MLKTVACFALLAILVTVGTSLDAHGQGKGRAGDMAASAKRYNKCLEVCGSKAKSACESRCSHK